MQQHKQTEVILDTAAAAELTRIKTPWLVGPIKWNNFLIKKAVIWLSLKLAKPILKLTEEDYREFGMNDILVEIGTAYNVNIGVFNQIQHTITGWPGGKPNAHISIGQNVNPISKKALIFSPHPDDDVISMGVHL